VIGVARPLAAAALVLALGSSTVQAHATAGLESIPNFDHIAVVVLENESYASTWGTGSPATYLNGLRAQGAFADQYYATGHVSLDNYVAMTSGQPDQPVTGSDCEAVNLYTCSRAQLAYDSGRNLGDQLDTAGLGWAGYMDSMPSPCFHADASTTASTDPYQGDSTTAPGNYADRHNPFLYYPDILDNNTRCVAHDLPYPQLGVDITNNAVPAFSFITPDTCHDGHDAPCAGGQPGGLTSADLWLSQQLPALINYMDSHNGLILITFDEGATTDTSGCCTGGPGGAAGIGGRVGLLALGNGITGGLVTHTQYDHASLLRTVEDSFGISEHLNNAGTATAMADLFAPVAALPEAPLLPLLVLPAAILVARSRWIAARRRA
jgi:phosphatidylinositol-3-phosphatase